jgi:VIT1/CCC1 family predicted Fe2+/Mn2+ transporter
MAAGEYVSVSSQVDLETADLKREQEELDTMPEGELIELAKIYESRGLDENLAMQVAIQLTEHNALEAHARDELGINEMTQAKPLQAALASGAAFIFGGSLPLLVSIFLPLAQMVWYQYVFAIVFLVVLGSVAAKAGGSSIMKAVGRITFCGTVAMGVTALVGYLFNVNIG